MQIIIAQSGCLLWTRHAYPQNRVNLFGALCGLNFGVIFLASEEDGWHHENETEEGDEWGNYGACVVKHVVVEC